MRLAKFSTRKEKRESEITIESVEVDLDFTQMYDCFLILSMGIKSTTSFQVLFYLLRIMGRDNNVIVNKKVIETFNIQRVKVGCPPVTGPTFYKCIRDLKEAGVMTNLPPNRGMYFLNPYAMWKADKKDRIAYLKEDAGPGQKIAINPVNLMLNDADHVYNQKKIPTQYEMDTICDNIVTQEELDELYADGQD
jgi:hypothetical protein